MKKRIQIIIILIISLFTLTGCYYTRGIDGSYFITALGLDEADGGLLKISVQIASTSGKSESSGSSQASSYKIFSVEATTIDEGISILNNYLNRQINLSHCSALIISEKLAKAGVKTYFNTFSNNSELRHSCKLIVSSTTATDVLENIANSGEVFSSRLFDYLTASADYTGFTIESTFGTFFQAIHNNSFEPIAIYITVNDNTVQTSGVAIFKDEFMIGHIDALDTICHLIVTNELNTCILTIDNPFDTQEKLDLEVSLYKDTKTSVQIINGSPYITLEVYPEGTIRSSGSTFNYIDYNNIETVENTANNYIERILKEYLYNITKNYDSDIVGFEGICKSQYLTEKEFETIHWEEIFKDSFFDVSIKTKINSSNLFNKE